MPPTSTTRIFIARPLAAWVPGDSTTSRATDKTDLVLLALPPTRTYCVVTSRVRSAPGVEETPARKPTGKAPSHNPMSPEVRSMIRSPSRRAPARPALETLEGRLAPVIGVYNKLVKLEGHDQTDRG